MYHKNTDYTLVQTINIIYTILNRLIAGDSWAFMGLEQITNKEKPPCHVLFQVGKNWSNDRKEGKWWKVNYLDQKG